MGLLINLSKVLPADGVSTYVHLPVLGRPCMVQEKRSHDDRIVGLARTMVGQGSLDYVRDDRTGEFHQATAYCDPSLERSLSDAIVKVSTRDCPRSIRQSASEDLSKASV